MLVAEVKASMNTVKVKQLLHLTRGTVGAEVLFSFGPEWEGLSRTAIFRTDLDARDVVNVQEGVPVEIPWEVLDKISDDLMVGVYGFDASHTVTIATAWASLGRIYPSARPSDQPSRPSSPNWTEQIQNQLDRTVQTARQAMDSVTAFSQEDENRTQAELQRQSAESDRQAGELLRCEAEKQRQESSRQWEQEQQRWTQFHQQAGDAEDRRAAAEVRRIDGETGRENREEERRTAEQARRDAEDGRRRSEDSRNREEERRIAAENKRKVLIDNGSVSENRTWSSLAMIENLCPEINVTGSLVSCHPALNYPMEVISRISPGQEGAGTPGPQNIRPIKARSRISLVSCLENLWRCERTFDRSECLHYDARTQTYTVPAGTAQFDGSICRLPTPIPTGTPVRLTVYFRQGYVSANSQIRIMAYRIAENAIRLNTVSVPLETDLKGRRSTSVMTIHADITDLWIRISTGTEIREDLVFQVMMTTGEPIVPYSPCSLKKYTRELPPGIYGGSFNWKTGRLVSEKAFFALPPDGPWTAHAENAMKLKLEDFGFSDRDGGLCETQAVGTVPGDAKYALALPGDGFVYLPFRTKEEVKASLEAAPIRLLLDRLEPETDSFPAAECPGAPGSNYYSSDTGETTVKGYESLNFAIGNMRADITRLDVHSGGSN